MNGQIKFFAILSLPLLAVSCNFFSPGPSTQPEKIFGAAEVRIRGQVFEAEVARTEQARELGLSGREKISETQAMYFVFDKPGRYDFWMKGTRFPLDIVWIENGKIADIKKSMQPPAPGEQPQSYTPALQADAVLEVNSGTAERYGWQAGDEVAVTYK